MTDDDAAELRAIEARKAEANVLLEDMKRKRAVWEAEAVLDEEFEKVAKAVQASWTRSVNGPDELGYSMREARVFLSLDEVRAIVTVQAKDDAHTNGCEFPPREPDGSLFVQESGFVGYISRSEGFIQHHLRSGDFVATGVDSKNPLTRVAVPRDAWNALIPNFLLSQAHTSDFALLAVRVRRPACAERTTEPRVGDEAIVSWLKSKTPEWERTSYPNRDIVERQAISELGNGVHRDDLRRLYEACKPPERKGPGRPRKLAK